MASLLSPHRYPTTKGNGIFQNILFHLLSFLTNQKVDHFNQFIKFIFKRQRDKETEKGERGSTPPVPSLSQCSGSSGVDCHEGTGPGSSRPARLPTLCVSAGTPALQDPKLTHEVVRFTLCLYPFSFCFPLLLRTGSSSN